MSVLPMVGGYLAFRWAMPQVSALGFIPNALKSGPANLALGLVTAGVLGSLVGMGAGMVGLPGGLIGGSVVMGGAIDVMAKVFSSYLLPTVAKAKAGLMGALGIEETYLSPEDYDAQVYDPLLESGPSSSTTPISMLPQLSGYGDYLSPQNAAGARPLGYTLNDLSIDGTAMAELAME
jgi:hypothetical protein